MEGAPGDEFVQAMIQREESRQPFWRKPGRPYAVFSFFFHRRLTAP
jgi:hypothetical protein